MISRHKIGTPVGQADWSILKVTQPSPLLGNFKLREGSFRALLDSEYSDACAGTWQLACWAVSTVSTFQSRECLS